MVKLTKEALDEVRIPALESPIDGQIYTVTLLAQVIANIRDQILWGLRSSAPTVYAKVRGQEIKAIKDGTSMVDVFVATVAAAADVLPKDGGSEDVAIRTARHQLTDVLEAFSPEAHAEYRAFKYPGGTSATPESRKEALLHAAKFIAKAALVPGY